jgi:hypothetical protein
LEDLDAEVESNSAWVTISENIKILESRLLWTGRISHGLTKVLKIIIIIIIQRKQAKLQWLQDSSEINWDNLNNVRCEARRHFRNKEGISDRQN